MERWSSTSLINEITAICKSKSNIDASLLKVTLSMIRNFKDQRSFEATLSPSLHDGVNGFLIAPRDIFALTKAMEFYVCNPDAVSEHSLKTLNIVRTNHDADNNCQLLFNCFKDIR